jgi:hypothetical protein
MSDPSSSSLSLPAAPVALPGPPANAWPLWFDCASDDRDALAHVLLREGLVGVDVALTEDDRHSSVAGHTRFAIGPFDCLVSLRFLSGHRTPLAWQGTARLANVLVHVAYGEDPGPVVRNLLAFVEDVHEATHAAVTTRQRKLL